MLQVRVLGPVEAMHGGRVVPVTSSRQRAILAALALRPNAVVSVDALLEALWGDDLPSNASGNLQAYISRLRGALGADTIVREHGGYRLTVDPTAVDVGQVQAAVDEARALRPDRPAAAADRFADALAFWRGRPLGDLADNPAFVPDVVRLDELKAALVDEHHDALLAAGRTDTALPGLEAAAAAAPLREPTQLLLMRGLHAAGRSVEALRAGERYRRRLVEEAGLDPTPELARLEQRILAGEPVVSVVGEVTADPLRTRRPLGLPRLGRFVGRSRELDELRACLARERLVSIVGSGGVGKTRLVAEALGDGDDALKWTVVVELAGVGEPDVVAAVAAALDLQAGAETLDRAVIEYLSIEDLLLVLDNCEHVATPVRAFVHRLLAACPAVTVVATSRERLGLPGEQVLELGPLPVDDAAEQVTPAAVELFLDRARRAAPDGDFGDTETITRLCRRLDGVPLALELAAGRVRTLGVAGLLDRLDNALDLLAMPRADATGRHETLRAVIDWSYRLLDTETALLFHLLAVFEPGFGLDAVEAVGGTVVSHPAAAMSRLADASLVVVDRTGPRPRYRVLDAVRAYANERLAGSAAAPGAHAAHAQFYVALLTRAAADIAGPSETAAASEVLTQRDNIRRALRFVSDHGDVEAVARAAVSVARVHLYRPDAELLAWARAAAENERDFDTCQRVAVLGAAARAAFLEGHLPASETLAMEAARSLSSAPRCEDADLVWHALGVVHLYRGDHAGAVEWWSRVTDDPGAAPIARADAVGGIALSRLYAGDLTGGKRASAELADLAESLDSDTYRAFADYVAGEVRLTTDRPAGVELLSRAAELARATGAQFVVGLATMALVSALVRLERPAEALPRFTELVELWRRSATWTQQWTTLRLLAELLAAEHRPDTAALLLEAADRDPAAPAVTGADADRLAELRDVLTERLGDDRSRDVHRRAQTWGRTRIVDAALAEVATLRAAQHT